MGMGTGMMAVAGMEMGMVMLVQVLVAGMEMGMVMLVLVLVAGMEMEMVMLVLVAAVAGVEMGMVVLAILLNHHLLSCLAKVYPGRRGVMRQPEPERNMVEGASS